MLARKLRKAAEEWAREVLPNVGKDERPFPAGYAKTTLRPGTMALEKGRGELIFLVGGSKVAGEQVADIRYVALTLRP